MKLKRNAPLNLSDHEPQLAAAPVAEPDNDLDLPPLDLSAKTEAGSGGVALEALPAAETEPMGEITPVAEPVVAQAAATPRAAAPKRGGGMIYLVAAVASVLWAALAIFAIGFQWPVGTVEFEPFQTAVFAVLALAPIGFIWIFAYGVGQAARLAAEIARDRELSETMLLPAASAAASAGQAVEDVRHEIEAATAAAASARHELVALREVLAEETARLTEAAAESARTAKALGENLSRERVELTTLSAKLDGQAIAVTDAVTRQAKMVGDASDLAQAQIGEAEAALAARAADLAAAAGEASDASRIASEDLNRQTLRLETATVGVGDQLRMLEDTLTQQRAELVTVAHGLRADNEDFAVRLESQRAQVADMLTKARLSVAEIDEASAKGAGAIRDLADTAAETCNQLAETLKAERDLLAAGALQSLGAVAEAAKYERETMEAGARRSLEAMADQAEASHKVAEGYTDAARAKIEALSEAAFAAGQKAEAAYEARLDEANGLIARSAELVDSAAAEAVLRLEGASAAARATLAELEAAVATFEIKAMSLPKEAAIQAEALKATLAGSFDDLLASARHAAEETQAIDQAFQERVRRNYEMLSEAVRLMGVVGPASRAALRADPAPRPTDRAPPQAAPPQGQPPAVEPEAPAARPGRRGLFERTARREPAPETARESAPEPAAEAGLRPRLKLSPTAADRETTAVFETADRAEPETTGWTWQELLGSIEGAPVDDEQLADRLLGEIEGLGVDLAAILPASRLQEVAAVLLAGDEPGAREVVRHLAPAAIRRLSRRLMSERPLRAQAERFVGRYQAAVDELARDSRDAADLTALLETEGGRAYLLFDAVLPDLP